MDGGHIRSTTRRIKGAEQGGLQARCRRCSALDRTSPDPMTRKDPTGALTSGVSGIATPRTRTADLSFTRVSSLPSGAIPRAWIIGHSHQLPAATPLLPRFLPAAQGAHSGARHRTSPEKGAIRGADVRHPARLLRRRPRALDGPALDPSHRPSPGRLRWTESLHRATSTTSSATLDSLSQHSSGSSVDHRRRVPS
jgi:hypothetical protein